MDTERLTPYVHLISSFVKGDITATDFETQYLNLYQDDDTQFSDEEFFILDELFGDVDAFCVDPRLHNEDDLSEEQLHDKCIAALKKLKWIMQERHIFAVEPVS